LSLAWAFLSTMLELFIIRSSFTCFFCCTMKLHHGGESFEVESKVIWVFRCESASTSTFSEFWEIVAQVFRVTQVFCWERVSSVIHYCRILFRGDIHELSLGRISHSLGRKVRESVQYKVYILYSGSRTNCNRGPWWGCNGITQVRFVDKQFVIFVVTFIHNFKSIIQKSVLSQRLIVFQFYVR